ncbi:hypothetical protein NC651_012701 [Populus alba x Populus x berolinensis]|nr:hypothetical protein NC651_012701 [Populus alba x Populus x berolinensis]
MLSSYIRIPYRHKTLYLFLYGSHSLYRPKSQRSMKAGRKGCFTRKMHHGVVETCLDCFLSGGILHVYRYGMSMLDLQLGSHVLCHTCTTKESKPASQVVETAKEKLEDGFGTYNLISNNCEDFATFCKLTVVRLWHVTCCEAYSKGAIDLRYKQLSPDTPSF